MQVFSLFQFDFDLSENWLGSRDLIELLVLKRNSSLSSHIKGGDNFGTLGGDRYREEILPVWETSC